MRLYSFMDKACSFAFAVGSRNSVRTVKKSTYYRHALSSKHLAPFETLSSDCRDSWSSGFLFLQQLFFLKKKETYARRCQYGKKDENKHTVVSADCCTSGVPCLGGIRDDVRKKLKVG